MWNNAALHLNEKAAEHKGIWTHFYKGEWCPKNYLCYFLSDMPLKYKKIFTFYT